MAGCAMDAGDKVEYKLEKEKEAKTVMRMYDHVQQRKNYLKTKSDKVRVFFFFSLCL